jgi:FkbM family methyltransferase
MSFDTSKESYLTYITRLFVEPSSALNDAVEAILGRDSSENPITSTDHNNLGVMALLEAAAASDEFKRTAYLTIAHGRFQMGCQLDANPLCRVHLAMVYLLSGDSSNCLPIVFKAFIDSVHQDFSGIYPSQPGMVYIPQNFGRRTKELATPVFLAKSAQIQARILASYLMLSAALCFYNDLGMRALDVLDNLLPDSGFIKLKLGVSWLMNGKTEGFLHLHESCQLCPDDPVTYHALCLGYKDAGYIEELSYWCQEAFARGLEATEAMSKQAWQWTHLPTDSPFTYLPFDGILLAAEANLRSIVTSVLLVDEDWFELEIEFWRTYLKPGMVVFDVGANVGVYTFSAATRVGSTGRVIAVEPTLSCVKCLQETIQINGLQQVVVYGVAASNTEGSVSFKFSSSSELNEVVSNDASQENGLTVVPCLPLDTICTRENIQRVDLIKIDAEGHELSVLQGALNVLATSRPVILYENIAGISGANLPVYDFLKAQGYQLYRYRQFGNQLIKIASVAELPGLLNVIAIHTGNTSQN